MWARHLLLLAFASVACAQARNDLDWPVYGGQQAGDRYSALTQINRKNVHRLQEAWCFDTGEKGGLQTNPLIVGRTLFAFTPTQKVIALDAATGKRLWIFDAGTPGLQPTRGLSYWSEGSERVLFAGLLTNLYALDPATGKPIERFGDHGKIDLRNDLDDAHPALSFAALTTPGVVYKDTIIVGFRAPETHPAVRGDIRAYDVRTGKLRWVFHTVPRPGEAGYETWPAGAWKTAGAANNWAGMALDAGRGIVYVPTGSAVDDFYGGDRLGDDLYANSLLALDANTGKRLWHFQGVHHDVWDRDFPSPPALLTVRTGGRKVDAVAQTTKQGFVFLFDRVTGKPLFPIDETAFPASAVPGETTSPTQPVPRLPVPFARQVFTAEMVTARTPEAHEAALQQYRTMRGGGFFVPLSLDRQTLVMPGFDGGAEWGGPAVDVKTGVLYVNANDIPWTGGLVANKPGGSAGSKVYQTQCAVCHGVDRKGAPPAFPSLVAVSKRLAEPEIVTVVQHGKGRMPSFPGVEGERLAALLSYLKTGEGDASLQNAPASLQNAPAVKYGDRSEAAGAKVYDRNCALCHGEDLLGAPSNYPGLLGVRERLPDARVLEIVHRGRGRMPALSRLSDEDDDALLRFLGKSAISLTEVASSKQEAQSAASADGAAFAEGAASADGAPPPYLFTGYRRFLDPDGYPAVVPPWGTLNAIDLNTGKYLWKIPLGEYPELAAKGVKDTGSENYGGPIVTSGGVVLIGATNFDHKLRAFDSRTGKLLWTGRLPYSGNATPATYMVDGRQYVAIAASGARDPKGPQGAAYVAFALPRHGHR